MVAASRGANRDFGKALCHRKCGKTGRNKSRARVQARKWKETVAENGRWDKETSGWTLKENRRPRREEGKDERKQERKYEEGRLLQRACWSKRTRGWFCGQSENAGQGAAQCSVGGPVRG